MTTGMILGSTTTTLIGYTSLYLFIGLASAVIISWALEGDSDDDFIVKVLMGTIVAWPIVMIVVALAVVAHAIRWSMR